jgi:hypothetical protein
MSVCRCEPKLDEGSRPLAAVAGFAQFGDAQFDSPGAGLPITLAVAVALT